MRNFILAAVALSFVTGGTILVECDSSFTPKTSTGLWSPLRSRYEVLEAPVTEAMRRPLASPLDHSPFFAWAQIAHGSPSSRQRQGTLVVDGVKNFHLRSRQQILFRMEPNHSDIAGRLVSLLQDHFRRWQSTSPSRDQASLPGFIDHQKSAYAQIQKQTWEAIRRIADDPSLRLFVARPYSSAVFEELITAVMPAYLGRSGWYCTPSLHAYSVPSGQIFQTATVLDIQPIESIETPDLGSDLVRRLGQEQFAVRQRLVVRPDTDEQSSGGIAFDHAYYGAIAQRGDSMDREIKGIIRGESNLMEQLRIPENRGPNFNLKVSLENLRSELKHGADAWELSRTTMQTLFFGMVHNAIESGRERGETPSQIVRRMREEIVDRHESSHLLDEWDPRQRIYEAFYSRLGDDMDRYRSALRFYLLNGEIDAAIGELRYGEPTIALERLLAFTGPEYDPARRAIGSMDEHYRARLWVRDMLTSMLAGAWGQRAGIQFVEGVAHDDQTKIQLFMLAQPDRERVLRALADAIKAKHDEAYLDPEETIRRITPDK